MTGLWPDAAELARLGYNESAIRGVLYTRELPDDDLLAAARDRASTAWQAMNDFMGSGVNPTWITSTCAETAYVRGLLGEQEFDWITR